MRPTARLDRLTKSAYRRAVRLRLLADEVRGPLTSADRRLLSYIVLDAALLWAEYSKAYYFCTAFRARDARGTRITHTGAIATADDALAFAVTLARPDVSPSKKKFTPRDHPDWKDPGVIRKLLDALNANTLASWQLGMGVSTRVTRDLPTMRNFFAHKGEFAAARARGLRKHYGITQNVTPWELLCVVPPAHRQPLLRSWLDDLAITIRMTG